MNDQVINVGEKITATGSFALKICDSFIVAHISLTIVVHHNSHTNCWLLLENDDVQHQIVQTANELADTLVNHNCRYFL